MSSETNTDELADDPTIIVGHSTPTTEFVVVWKMAIEATDHVAAAKEALRVQRDPESIATVYQVKGSDADSVTVDLMDHEPTENPPNGYQNGYRDGYARARDFYGHTAPDSLQRIAEATTELRTQIEAAGSAPAALLRYLDIIQANTAKM